MKKTSLMVAVGLLEPLVAEVQKTDDLLTCLAALQLMKELAAQHAFSHVILSQLLPALMANLHPETDETLLCAGLDAVASLLTKHTTGTLALDFFRALQHLLLVRLLSMYNMTCNY